MNKHERLSFALAMLSIANFYADRKKSPEELLKLAKDFSVFNGICELCGDNPCNCKIYRVKKGR